MQTATTPRKSLSEIQAQLIVLQAGQDSLAEITINLQAQVAVSIELVRRLDEILTPTEDPSSKISSPA